MLDTKTLDGLKKLIDLFNIHDKQSVEKYCRNLVFSSDDLFHAVIAGRSGAMTPYVYACHFSNSTPEHLQPNKRDLSALASNGVGLLRPSAKKAMTKISQIFIERRMFSAHLFYTPSKKYWHLFYFDQRDVDASRNHWKRGGPHIHYSRESFCREPLDEVWKNICTDAPSPPKAIHIRYDYHHNRPRVRKS